MIVIPPQQPAQHLVEVLKLGYGTKLPVWFQSAFLYLISKCVISSLTKSYCMVDNQEN